MKQRNPTHLVIIDEDTNSGDEIAIVSCWWTEKILSLDLLHTFSHDASSLIDGTDVIVVGRVGTGGGTSTGNDMGREGALGVSSPTSSNGLLLFPSILVLCRNRDVAQPANNKAILGLL
jgi:hypothetical protein